MLIASNFRSGSSFLGSVLNSYPGTFYSYEPLQFTHNFYDKEDESLHEKDIEVLKMIFKCDFEPEEKDLLHYFSYFENKKDSEFFSLNSRLWQRCTKKKKKGKKNQVCFSPELHERICPYFPLRVAKESSE